MQLEYVKNISQASADMYIYDTIGDYGINAQNFVKELNWLQNDLKTPVINIRVNSPGGSVIAGLGIFAAIANATAQINTYNDGIAASMAGVVVMAGKNRFMVTHGLLMIHDVSIPKEVLDQMQPDEKAKALAAMAAMRTSLVSILTANSKKNEDEITAMLQKETWLGSADALEMGLIDSVYDPTPAKRMEKNELMQIVNTIIQKPNIKSMKLINKILNLDESTTEDVAVSEIEKLNADLEAEKTAKEAAEQKAADLQTRLDGLEAEKANATDEAVTTEATTEVENAINAGKFSADKKAELIASAKKDLTGFKNLVASISATPPASITSQLNKAGNKDEADRSTWTIRDWEKKDPIGLAKMQNENMEGYKNLYNALYNPSKI